MADLRCHCESSAVVAVVRLVPRRTCTLSHNHGALHAWDTAYSQPSCQRHLSETMAAGTVVACTPIGEAA